jgi:ClpP class serine protease
LTGSIGVVGGKLVLGGALEEIGIKSYAVGKGARSTMWSPMQAWTEGEREAVYKMMEQTYEAFLARVAQGRKMERDAVHELAQGRVWTGAAAKEKGLVDELGGLDVALAQARSRATIVPAPLRSLIDTRVHWPRLDEVPPIPLGGAWGQAISASLDPARLDPAIAELIGLLAGSDRALYYATGLPKID